MMRLKSVIAASLAVLTLVGFASTAGAAEGGAGVYLLGKRGPLAAFVPKPGWYLTNDVFFLTADRSELTPLGDRIVGNVDAEAPPHAPRRRRIRGSAAARSSSRLPGVPNS